MSGLEKFTIENQEKRKYYYIDNNIQKIIFECEADDILDADNQYNKITGNDLRKQSYVGCCREDWITKEALEKLKNNS